MHGFPSTNRKWVPTKAPISCWLTEIRARYSFNQQEMGALVGTSRQTISLIERGDYSPSVTLALKIARVFDVPVEDIFYYEDENEGEEEYENKK